MTDYPKTQSARPPKDSSGLVLAGAPSAPAISLTPEDRRAWLHVLGRLTRRGAVSASGVHRMLTTDRCDYDIMLRLGKTTKADLQSAAHALLLATVTFGLDPGTAFTPWSRAHRSRSAGLRRRERARREYE